MFQAYHCFIAYSIYQFCQFKLGHAMLFPLSQIIIISSAFQMRRGNSIQMTFFSKETLTLWNAFSYKCFHECQDKDQLSFILFRLFGFLLHPLSFRSYSSFIITVAFYLECLLCHVVDEIKYYKNMKKSFGVKSCKNEIIFYIP